jgi:hypothetical protein
MRSHIDISSDWLFFKCLHLVYDTTVRSLHFPSYVACYITHADHTFLGDEHISLLLFVAKAHNAVLSVFQAPITIHSTHTAAETITIYTPLLQSQGHHALVFHCSEP